MQVFNRYISLIIRIGICVNLCACTLLLDRPSLLTQGQRDEAFARGQLPLRDPSLVRWNEYSVPMIEAASDRDLFVTWGYTTTHLRWGQMELLRRISQGRASESVGVFAVDLDHTIRILNLQKNLDQRISNLPKESREFLEAYLEGINAYIESADQLPWEFHLLGWEVEKWTLKDLLIMGRLVAFDLTLGFYYQYLQVEKNPEFQKRWEELRKKKDQSELSAQLGISGQSISEQNLAHQSVEQNLAHQSVGEQLLWGLTKSGSNSLVVGRQLTGGSAVIANDPHLGIFLPNLWMVVGLRSPSFSAVGLSIPGLPFLGVGRSLDHAWGGTNMRSVSSHLYEISAEESKKSKERKEKIAIRFWPDREVRVRDTEYGPIISDSPFFKSDRILVVDWVGHDADGDEITAFLKAARAKSFEEFRGAFHSYAVSGQNMTYANREGDIGLVLAAKFRKFLDPKLAIQPIKSLEHFSRQSLRPTDLPYSLNPESGFIGSANNKPLATDFEVAQSFAAGDRIQRIKQLTLDQKQTKGRFDFSFLRSLQLDVVSVSSKELANSLGQIWDSEPESENFGKLLKEWDGSYAIESRAAVVFEVFLARLSEDLAKDLAIKDMPIEVRDSELGKIPIKDQLRLLLATEDRTSNLWRRLLKATKASVGGTPMKWGDFHKQVLQTPLGFAPLIGSRYRRSEFPAPGGNDTLHKAGHRLSVEPGKVTYGAQSRHISLLEDVDENYFALLGGQDGWLWSPSIDDQVGLWQRGEYFRFPLSEKGLENDFKKVFHFKGKN